MTSYEFNNENSSVHALLTFSAKAELVHENSLKFPYPLSLRFHFLNYEILNWRKGIKIIYLCSKTLALEYPKQQPGPLCWIGCFALQVTLTSPLITLIQTHRGGGTAVSNQQCRALFRLL